MSKELQKITKLTVQVLKEENALAVRGLKDLQLLNTPRILYLAGQYDECINLCVEMINWIEAPEPEDEEERLNYKLYWPTKYIVEPVKLSKEDYWYWNLSLQKVGRFFVTDEESNEDRDYTEKGWAYPILLSKVGISECVELFEERLRNNLVCNADYWYYAVCLQRKWDIIGAIENFTKSLEIKVTSKHFQKSALRELWKIKAEKQT